MVYGDIGTSPLYAFKESLAALHAPITAENVFGILSLIFWSLILMIVIKYITFVMRADNRGEGGILALLGLLVSKFKDSKPTARADFLWIYVGMFGAALLYGDGVITPAISVLSAVEGIGIAIPQAHEWILPLTVAILIALFASQKRGTGSLGSIFGKIMILWFITLAITGVIWILRYPQVLGAISPHHAISFFNRHGMAGFWILGSVVLVVTGGEALFADMGHFGKLPLRIGWFSVVMPALTLNYFGQGALVLTKGAEVVSNPFYGLVEGAWIYPLILISACATVIASQALISGAFTLTHQAVQLGFFPRMRVLHTSFEHEGQIYVPKMNLMLAVSCIYLVIQYPDSSQLAAAYGIAVTGTMLITSLLFFEVTRKVWNWPLSAAIALSAFFLFMDLSFFTANIVKFFHGGWIPLLIASILFIMMTTWSRGREALRTALITDSMPLEQYLLAQEKNPEIRRVEGTAVFMTLTRNIAPSALVHHLNHNQAIQKRVILLSVSITHQPIMSIEERVTLKELPMGFTKIHAQYGYMEIPDIVALIKFCAKKFDMDIDFEDVSFYLGRETLIATGNSKMAWWRKKLYIFFSRNSRPASEYFRIPADKVIEIGTQIRI